MAYQGRSHTPAPANGAFLKLPVIVTSSKTAGTKLVSARNPEKDGVIQREAWIHIKTPSTAACTLDIGTASTDVTSDTLMDGVNGNAPVNTVYDNDTDHGTNGTTRQYVASSGYFTVYVASGDANGLVADVYFVAHTLKGGSPQN